MGARDAERLRAAPPVGLGATIVCGGHADHPLPRPVSYSSHGVDTFLVASTAAFRFPAGRLSAVASLAGVDLHLDHGAALGEDLLERALHPALLDGVGERLDLLDHAGGNGGEGGGVLAESTSSTRVWEVTAARSSFMSLASTFAPVENSLPIAAQTGFGLLSVSSRMWRGATRERACLT